MLPFLLDLLFPKKSLTGEEGSWITEQEVRAMKTEPLRLTKFLLRKEGMRSLDCLIAAGQYSSSPLLRRAIRTFKYGRVCDLHWPLSQMILDTLPGLYLPPRKKLSSPHCPLSIVNDLPTLCPVPLHWIREYHRGFNQARLLAEDIADAKKWQMAELLKRVHATGHQAWRKRDERLKALSGAFTYIGPTPTPRYVILIDDLATTGATLDSCAKVLKEAGCRRVEAFVVARG